MLHHLAYCLGGLAVRVDRIATANPVKSKRLYRSPCCDGALRPPVPEFSPKRPYMMHSQSYAVRVMFLASICVTPALFGAEASTGDSDIDLS